MVLLTSAGLELGRGNAAGAEAYLRQVDLRTSAAARTRALTLIAQAQEIQGKTAGADASYRAAMAATTEEPRARYAAFLLHQGKREEAAGQLEAPENAERRATGLYRK